MVQLLFLLKSLTGPQKCVACKFYGVPGTCLYDTVFQVFWIYATERNVFGWGHMQTGASAIENWKLHKINMQSFFFRCESYHQSDGWSEEEQNFKLPDLWGLRSSYISHHCMKTFWVLNTSVQILSNFFWIVSTPNYQVPSDCNKLYINCLFD